MSGLDDLTFDAATALLVVDVQNDFADPEGNLYVPGGEETIAVINEAAAKANDAGAYVVYTQDWHPPDTPHFEKDGGVWPVHCVRDTWGAELHPDLDVHGPVVKKGTGGEDGYSGFTIRDPETGAESPTGLADLLADHGIERVVVCGLALDVCVLETALDAVDLDLETVLLADGSRPVNLEPGDGTRAAARMANAGVEVV